MKIIMVDKNKGIKDALDQCDIEDVVLIPAGTYEAKISSEVPHQLESIPHILDK